MPSEQPTTDNGGQAFPRPGSEYAAAAEGMTLLDYIAIESMKARIRNSPRLESNFLASEAYKDAEAMIKEKRKR